MIEGADASAPGNAGAGATDSLFHYSTSMSLMKLLERVEQRLEALEHLMRDHTDDILDVGGAMALTGLSKSGIYHKTCSQEGAPPELGHFKRGKRLYFRRSELVRWITENRIKDRTEIEADAQAYWKQGEPSGTKPSPKQSSAVQPSGMHLTRRVASHRAHRPRL